MINLPLVGDKNTLDLHRKLGSIRDEIDKKSAYFRHSDLRADVETVYEMLEYRFVALTANDHH